VARILVAILLFSPLFALVPPEKSTRVLQEVSQAEADYYIAAMGSPYQRVLNVAERYRVVMLDPGVFEQAVSSSQRYTRLADSSRNRRGKTDDLGLISLNLFNDVDVIVKELKLIRRMSLSQTTPDGVLLPLTISRYEIKTDSMIANAVMYLLGYRISVSANGVSAKFPIHTGRMQYRIYPVFPESMQTNEGPVPHLVVEFDSFNPNVNKAFTFRCSDDPS